MRKKKIFELIDSYNEKVNEYAKELRNFSQFIDPIYVNITVSNFLKIYKFDVLECEFNLYYDVITKEKLYDDVISSEKLVEKNFKSILENFNSLEKRAKENKEVLDKFFNSVDSRTSGFITLERLCNGKKTYMYMQYYTFMKDGEFFTKEGEYSICGITHDQSASKELIVDYKTYSIRWMTNYEFSYEYLPSRISICGIENEIELENYTKELTNFFKNSLKNESC